MAGPYKITDAARVWGRAWYEQTWTSRSTSLDDERLDGYIARKQTHLHKLAIVLAAAARDDLVIEIDDLMLANTMLESVEGDLDKVFSRIGRTEDSLQSERFIQYLKRKGDCSYESAYRYIHSYFPNFKDFESILAGTVRAGYITMTQKGSEFWLYYSGPKDTPT